MPDKKISELVEITGSATAADDFFVIVDSSGAATNKISRAELNNAIEQDVLASVDITTANIDGGTIDGTVIGGTTPAAGSFTTLETSGNATVGGDLTVNGTTTTINSTTLTVDDLNITLASGAVSAAAADGAGLTVDGASATFNYASTGDKWTTNKPLDVTGTVTATSFSGDGSSLTGIATDVVDDTTPALGGNLDINGNNITGTGDIDITGSVNADDAVFDGTGAVKVPVGTTAERPTPAQGQIRYNTTDGSFEGYDGSAWGAIGGGAETSFTLFEYTATAGQTTFSGSDDNAATLAYTAGSIIVFLNGVALDPADYTATNGTSVVLASGAALNDELNIFAFSAFNVSDTVAASTGGTFNGGIIATSFTGDGSGLTGIQAGAGYFQGENGATGDTTNGKGDIFRVHEQQLDTNTTIASGDNAGCFFNLTVATGVTLTVNGNLVIA